MEVKEGPAQGSKAPDLTPEQLAAVAKALGAEPAPEKTADGKVTERNVATKTATATASRPATATAAPTTFTAETIDAMSPEQYDANREAILAEHLKF